VRPARRALACLAPLWLAVNPTPAAQDRPASIAGVVEVSDRGGGPARHALVTAQHLESSMALSAVTDNAGRFAFRQLRPGRYVVSASKAAYLTSTHGSTRPGRPGTTIVLAPGQTVDDVRFSLVRGAALSGTIRDESGNPASDLVVVVAPAATAATVSLALLGQPSDTDSTRTVITDNTGAYRAFGLAPGSYVVGALPAAPATYAARMAGGGDRGPRYSYGPIFYPGTPSADEATAVPVRAGEEREGLDFQFALVPTVTVYGTAYWPGGQPAAGVSLALRPLGPPLPPRLIRSGSAKAEPDGQFGFGDVAPGRYQLRAFGATSSGLQAWATADVAVGGGHVTGLTLTLQPAMSFSGRISLDGSGAPPPARIMLRDASSAAAAQPEPATAAERNLQRLMALTGAVAASASATSRPDGTFEVTGIPPGRFQLSVSVPALGGRVWLESAIANGRDLLDMPLDFGTSLGDVKDAVLTLTTATTALSGRLETTAGLPASDYYVILFSADRAHRFPGARRTRAVRPASDGSFAVGELPAGAYLIAAVTDAYPDGWQHAAFLEQLASFAVPVTVRAGETTTQNLRIAK
jgi:protocatechuate 3,4-dioxygenase beta subunit